MHLRDADDVADLGLREVLLEAQAQDLALAEGVEAWAFRTMQDRAEFVDRRTAARLWFDEDYEPVTALLSDADLIERGESETDAYMRVVTARYMLLRTHEWSDEVLERLQSAQRDKRRTRMPPKRRHGKRPGY